DVDAVACHVGDVRGAVVVPRQDVVEPQARHALVGLLTTRGRLDAEAALRRPTIEAPAVTTVDSAHHARGAIAQRRGDTVEHMRRLVDVAVGGDDALRHRNHDKTLPATWFTRDRST